MHNNIMAAGSRDRPPMLATGRYAQWRSRFLRYIDTRPNGDALRKCILKGPYTPTIVTTPAVPATENSPAVPEQTTVETVMNMTPENRAHFESEKEAIHLILTGIGDEIYSICLMHVRSSRNVGKTIERIQQEWSRFVTIVKQQHKLDEVSYHKLFDILKQYQKEVNELRAERKARMLNLLALNENQTRQFGNQRAVNVAGARETVGGQVVQQSRIQCFNYKEFGHYAKECRKPKRTQMKEKLMNKELESTLQLLAKTLGVPNADSSTKLMPLKVKKCLMPLALKTQNDSLAFIHELKKEMHADLKYVESLEDELDELESDKAEFSNMYDMLLQECVSKDVMCSYLLTSSDLDEITELQCLYLHKVMECDCLAQKLSEQTDFVSKEIYTELLQRFARLEKHSISLEIALQECQVQLKNDTVCKERASNVFRKEREQYVEIQDLKAQMQDKNMAISELKKLVAKCKGKSVDTKFDKPSVVRQPNAQRIPKPSVLGKPAPFSNSLERQYFAKKKSVLKTNESESLSKPVTLQNLPKTAMKAVRNTNVIKPGMYRIASSTTQTRAPQLNQTFRNTNPRASTSTGIAHKTNVSRPQPRSNQMKDKVVPYTSHAKLKKTEVEEHPRISSISNKTKSVTACNDSLNSRTSNANAVCATCGKCVFNSNHDACVSKFLNDVNARTKKPNVVPISTRKPKRQANKSVATPHKKTVASESTTTSSKSYYRMLYQKTSKAWKWWIAQQCPSSYTWVPKTQKKWVPRTQKKWVPKTQKQWVPKVRNESVPKRVSFAIVQLILFIVDSGCTKHMTGNVSLLCNFVDKFLGTVRFGNDQFAPILGYGDLIQGNITIKRVYYVEGLNHNLFSVGQFCDADLEVAFRKSTCFVRDLQGNDLLTGNRGSDLYTISLQDSTHQLPICLS
ncbi:retrovirus-related pol polyprotein from transposon TNT 1-94 [Tanacetum coccineum]